MEVRVGMDMRLWGEATGVAQFPVLEMLQQQGYEGVEVPLAGGQGNSELKLLAVALVDLGLDVCTWTRLPREANPVSPDPAIRAAALDFLKERLDESAILGSRLLSGGLFQAQGVFSGHSPTDREWDWSRRFLHQAGEYAAARGIKLALEFQSRFDAHLVNTATDAARMCADVGLDNVGVLYNTYQAHLEEINPARALPSPGSNLMHVHLSESHRGELGRGQVQWNETFATLDFLDYSGWLMVQALGVGQPHTAHPTNIWRNNFDSREQLSADAIALVKQVLRQQRQ